MPKPTTVYALSRVVSPITQMAGSAGNRALIQREEVVTRLGLRRIPKLSGNAIRASAVRQPGLKWLIEQAGLGERLTKPMAYFLLRGGAEYTGNGGRESVADIVHIAEVAPIIGLLGGVVPKQMFGGSINVDAGVLLCEENRSRLSTFLPPGVSLDEFDLPPASDFTGDYQYTRNGREEATSGFYSEEEDATARFTAAASGFDHLPGENSGKSNQMIYSGECVRPGAIFVHRFTIAHPKRLEVGALLFSLRLWSAYGNKIGGMGRVGHGQLLSQYHFDPAYNGADDEYAEHAIKHAPQLADWLKKQFEFKEPSEKPAKKGKAKKNEAAEEPA